MGWPDFFHELLICIHTIGIVSVVTGISAGGEAVSGNRGDNGDLVSPVARIDYSPERLT